MCDDPVRQATIGDAGYHLTCYNAAFVRHDDYAMQREMTWARGKSRNAVFIDATAEIALYHGRLDESHRLFGAARQSALANNLPRFAARMGLNEAAMEAELGLLTAARHDALDALAIGPDDAAEDATAALVWALLGDLERANEAIKKANKQSPLDTLLNHAAIPEVQAVIDLKRNQPEEALRQLEQVRPMTCANRWTSRQVFYRAWLTCSPANPNGPPPSSGMFSAIAPPPHTPCTSCSHNCSWRKSSRSRKIPAPQPCSRANSKRTGRKQTSLCSTARFAHTDYETSPQLRTSAPPDHPPRPAVGPLDCPPRSDEFLLAATEQNLRADGQEAMPADDWIGGAARSVAKD